VTAPPTATLQLLPFRAVRYNPSVSDLAAVIAPPYDVIDDAQQSALEAADPHNVVRLILPRDPGVAGVDRYAAAAQTFEQWLDDETLRVDDTPALYVYQQTRAGVVLQRGLLGAVILPHENVRPGPVEDRLALMRAMRANPEPIFLLYDGGGAATTSSALAVTHDPLATAVTSDGITHELWAITDRQELEAIAADLAGRTAMIADGHHRYTTYGYLRDELHAAGHGAGPWDAGLTLLVDASVATPDIRAIHRVVPNLSLEQALAAAVHAFRVVRLDAGVASIDDALALLAEHEGPAFLVADGRSFTLLVDPDPDLLAAAKPPDRTPAWWALDASVASVFVLESLLGVSDAAGQVEAEHDPAAALRLVERDGGIALFLKPAPLAGIVAVAEAGDAMPRKSTLFLPKPRSGMAMRAFRFEG